MINCTTLKTISQHIIYIIYSNNVVIHFTFVEIKETYFGYILALNSWIIPSPPPFSQKYFLFYLWWLFLGGNIDNIVGLFIFTK
jgi:hypothetical protein